MRPLVNSWTEAYCCAWDAPPAPGLRHARVGTGNSCSPLSRSTVRLVTSATTPGAHQQGGDQRSGPVTCSKLSSRSSSCREHRYDSRSLSSLPPEVFSRARRRCRRRQVGGRDRRQVDEPRSFPETRREAPRGLDRQPSLSTPRARQRHQAHAFAYHQVANRLGLLVAADQRRRWLGRGPGGPHRAAVRPSAISKRSLSNWARSFSTGAQICGGGEVLIGNVGGFPDPVEHRRQLRLAFGPALPVEQPGSPTAIRYSYSSPDSCSPGATHP